MSPPASARLRVVGGRYRGRRLMSLAGMATRPMLGRLRQRMFDILQGRVEGRVFADLYAGTGAVGIEALSRGARRAVFVDDSARAVRVIRKNLELLGLSAQANVCQGTVRRVIGRLHADLWFLGPPYEAHQEYLDTLAALSRRPVGIVIAQHSRDLKLASRYGRLERVRVVRTGRNRLSFFEPDSGDGPAGARVLRGPPG